MYAYIDRKKKFPVTTFLEQLVMKAIKIFLDIFGLAEEVKVAKQVLRKCWEKT